MLSRRFMERYGYQIGCGLLESIKKGHTNIDEYKLHSEYEKNIDTIMQTTPIKSLFNMAKNKQVKTYDPPTAFRRGLQLAFADQLMPTNLQNRKSKYGIRITI